MKKYNLFSSFIICAFLTLLFSTTAFANSSWQWISKTRPFDILPFVALVTLVAEALTVNFSSKANNLKKVFCFVALANLAKAL